MAFGQAGSGTIPAEVLDRYLYLIGHEPSCEPDPGTSLPHLAWMLSELKSGNVRGYKAHRWLGFVQGILIANGHATVPEEREFTRPYLKPLQSQDES